MKKSRIYADYLQDMLDAAQYAHQFIVGMTFESFTGDVRTQFAVIRALEIIGEASKNIPQAIKAKHSEVPWREIAGMRDKMVHDYIGVNLRVVWKTVEEDIASLIPLLNSC